MRFRGAYLGTPGDMFLFARLKGKQDVSLSREMTYKTTLGGRQRVQVSPQVLREWSCEMPFAVPEEVSRFKGLASGLYGLGPFAWVPVAASVSNALTLAESMPGPKYAAWSGAATPAGAWHVPGMGLVRHSLIADGALITMGEGTPVVAGAPVTAAVYVSGSGSCTVYAQTVDEAGNILDNASQTLSVSNDPARVAVTIPAAPPAAVSCRVRVAGAQQVGLPSISWTKRAMPWVPGAGSNSVTVEGFDASPEHIDREGNLYEGVSFTVKELASDA